MVPSLWAGSIWNPAHERRNNHINCLSLIDERVIRSAVLPRWVEGRIATLSPCALPAIGETSVVAGVSPRLSLSTN